MKTNEIFSLESIVGFFVLLICLLFSYKVYNVTKKSGSSFNTETFKAVFLNVEGIYLGSDVKIGGVKVGSVDRIILSNDLSVLVYIKINNTIKLPIDSSIEIKTSGLLGSKFLSILPGSEEENMLVNDYFYNTKSAIDIEKLIGKFAVKQKS